MRLLIVKLSSLGDHFHALPAVHALREGLGAEAVDWVTTSGYEGLVRCFSDVDRAIPFPRHTFLRQFRPFVRYLRSRHYDMVVDLQGLQKSALVARLAYADRRIGPSFHREWSRLHYTDIAGKRNKDRHAVEECLDVARYLDLPVGEPSFPVTFPTRSLAEGHPRIAISAMTRWPSKNWPVERFTEVANLLKQECGATIFLMGGPEDRSVCRTMARGIEGSVVNLGATCSIPEAGGVLSQMDLLISCDSGPVHMAAATGTPCLVIFGPTNADRTGPYGTGHRILQVDEDCVPCLARTCGRPGHPCMSRITPAQVAAAAAEMLSDG